MNCFCDIATPFRVGMILGALFMFIIVMSLKSNPKKDKKDDDN